MNIVLNDKAIDDTYSAEVIAKARELSPELDEYVVTQRYLLETAADNVSPLWLRNRLLLKLLDQLEERGIFMNQQKDDILDSPLLVSTVLYLRSKFDQDNLYKFLVNRSEIREYIQSVNDEADCIGEIISYCNNVLPLDEGWEALARIVDSRPGLISSSEVFTGTVIQPVLDKISRLGEDDTITDDNRSVVDCYIGYLSERKQKIAKAASDIYSTKISSTEGTTIETVESGAAAVENLMSGFERELARPNVVSKLDPNSKDIKIGDIRAKYVKKWPHTLDYWVSPEHAEEVPNELQFAVLVATMFVDYGGGPDARVKVIEAFEDVGDMLGDRYMRFRDLLDNALANLVMVKEGGVS